MKWLNGKNNANAGYLASRVDKKTTPWSKEAISFSTFDEAATNLRCFGFVDSTSASIPDSAYVIALL